MWANAAALEFDPQPSEAAFSTDFFAVASDRKELVMSYPEHMWQVGTDVPVKVSDSIQNGSGDMRHFRPFFELR